VAEVAAACLFNRVVVDLNDLVQVAGDDLCDFMELLEVKLATLVVNERRQGKRSQVANGDLIGSGVLDNLSAQVRAADGTKVLLVALAVASVLVEHEGVTSLGLSLEDGIPKLLGTDSLATLVLLLVALVQSFELVTVDIGETGALIGAHECPIAIVLDTLHEEVRNPQSVEEIASADFLFAVVLAQVEEAKDVSVPWLKVDSKGTWTLVATLVDIASSVVVYTEHRNETVGCSVGATDV
jgi:hypothetical protein